MIWYSITHLINMNWMTKQFVSWLPKWNSLLIFTPINIFCFLGFFVCLFLKIIYLFIYLWLCWVFASVWGLSLVVASGDHSSSRCVDLLLSRPLSLRSTGSRCAGSAIVAHGPSCSAACGIFPDQGPNPCPLHWQADSQPLRHQGSPVFVFVLPCQAACGILVPGLGIEPGPWLWKLHVLVTGPPGNSLLQLILIFFPPNIKGLFYAW